MRWRSVENGIMTDYVLCEGELGNADAPNIAMYVYLEDNFRESFDIREKQKINAAYNTLNRLPDAAGTVMVYGNVVDESGNPIFNEEIILKSSSFDEPLYECTTDEKGKYEIRLPMEQEEYLLSNDGTTQNDIKIQVDMTELDIQAGSLIVD